MFWETVSAARDLGRLQQITSILIRYGFGGLVQRMGLAGVLERAGKVVRWKQATELAQLERASTPGHGGDGADVRQAWSDSRHPGRSAPT